MKKFIFDFINSSFWIVCLYGVFVIISLLLQCFIPFIQKFGDITNLAFISTFLNEEFVLPMDVITSLWTAIAAGYVGLDRGMFALDGFKNGTHIEAFTETKRKQLFQIIVLTGAIYSTAVILNIFFAAALSLLPLATAFGTTVLCYVLGNKVIGGAQQLHPDDDLDQDGVKDSDQYNRTELAELKSKYEKLKETTANSQCIMHGQLSKEQSAALAQMIVAMKAGKQVNAIIDATGKMIFKELDRMQTRS